MASDAKRADPHKRSLADWLKVKRNFLIFSMIAVGVLPGLVIVWWLGATRDVPLFFAPFLIALSAGAGYVWGLVMWHFFQFKRERGKRVVKEKDDV